MRITGSGPEADRERVRAGECPFWSPDEAMRGISPDTRAFAALQAKALAANDGQADSLKTIQAAVDLVMRCLEIEPQDRPTADMVCDHAFLVGSEDGWHGEHGWDCKREE